MSFFLYSICIFREVLLIITIFTNSDCLGDILSHRNNFPDDFEAIRKFISRYSKFTRYLISIIICNDKIYIATVAIHSLLIAA